MSYKILGIPASARPARKKSLTRMVLASKGKLCEQVENDQLSLTQLRETLFSPIAVEVPETVQAEGRLTRWLDRTRRTAEKLAAEPANAAPVFDAQGFFTMARK